MKKLIAVMMIVVMMSATVCYADESTTDLYVKVMKNMSAIYKENGGYNSDELIVMAYNTFQLYEHMLALDLATNVMNAKTSAEKEVSLSLMKIKATGIWITTEILTDDYGNWLSGKMDGNEFSSKLVKLIDIAIEGK